MLKQCQDSYHSTFGTYEDMLDYHEEQVKASQWQRCQVNTLQVESLDKASPLYGSLSDFAAGVTQEAVDDTAENLGLAIRVCIAIKKTDTEKRGTCLAHRLQELA